MLHGLVYLHKERRTIHRDIKPSNLLVDAAGNVKIADFGMAVVSQEKCSGKNLRTSMLAGTPAFIAPEICAPELVGISDALLDTHVDGEINGKAADMWAFGVTLWFYAFGEAPYRGGTVISLYEKIVRDPLVFPEVEPAIVPDFQAMLSRTMTSTLASNETICCTICSNNNGSVSGLLCRTL